MDDEFIKRFFGTPIDPLGRGSGNNMDGNENFLQHDINQMFRDMENMMSMFHPSQFSMIESHPQFNHPSIEQEDTGEGKNLRDSFLKSKSRLNEQERGQSVYSNPNSFMEKFFEFPDRPMLKDNDSFEEDLDEKVARDGFGTVLREDLLKKNTDRRKVGPFQQNMFFGQSSSVRRVQRPDGSVEEIKTEKSSDGAERTTTTRIIGDKSHTLVEKKVKGQVQETEEFFENFDHDKIEEFDKMWSGSSEPSQPRNQLLNEHPISVDQNKMLTEPPKNSSLVSKLFSWFK